MGFRALVLVVGLTAMGCGMAGAMPIPGGAAHPRLFLTGDTVARLKELATREPSVRKWMNGLRGTARRAVGGPLSPEPRFLTGLKGPERGRVYAEIFREIRPPVAQMEACALAYALTGDAAAGAEAKRRLLHYIAFDPDGSTNTFHNDEPAMSILWNGTHAYDWTYSLYTAEERAKIESVLVKRAKAVYDLLNKHRFHVDPRNSHLGRQIGFLGAACLALGREHPEMETWYGYVMETYRTVFPAWGRDDGGWNEGPHYWTWYMEWALEYMMALRQAGADDGVLSRKPFFRATPYFFVYQCAPGAPLSPFGDGGQFTRWAPNVVRTFAEFFDDPVLRWFADAYHLPAAHNLVSALALLPTRRIAPPSADFPQTRFFPGVGLVCSHSDIVHPTNDVFFTLRASPYGSVSHGHNDQNCFVLSAYGEGLAIPSGYYNFYGSPHHDKWTRSTRAKSGIVYDNVTSQVRGERAKSALTNFSATNGVVVFTGDATAAYGGALTEARRDVVRLGADLFVLRDRLAAPKPHTWKYTLNAFERMETDEAAQRVRIARGAARLDVRFLGPRKVSFEQVNAFDPPPVEFVRNLKVPWHLEAATPPCTATSIVSVLETRRADDPRPEAEVVWSPGASRGEDCVQVRARDGRRWSVRFGSGSAGPEVKSLP